MAFEAFLKSKIEQGTAKIIDGVWFDNLTSKANDQITKINDPYFKVGAQVALDQIIERKADLIGLTDAAVGLMFHQLALGDTHAAMMTYIEQYASVDDLIDGMITDANSEIALKKRQEELKANALEVLKKIGKATATHLLPIILTMII